MNIPFKQHVEQNCRPKLKSDKEKAQFAWMADAFSFLGVDAYHLSPNEILANLEHKEYENWDKYAQEEWLDFISHPVISKFLENSILKLNTVSLRKKLVELSRNDNVSQADVKLISILKEIVDGARNAQEDSVIHISSFFPPRYNNEEDVAFPEARQNELRNLVSYLGIDSDYMESIDKETFIKKEEAKAAKIASLTQTATVSQRKAEARASKDKLKTKFDALKAMSEVE